MSDDLKIGDLVTWRSSPNALTMTGCRIVRFVDAVDDDNKPVPGAVLDCGQFGEVVAARSALHKEPADAA